MSSYHCIVALACALLAVVSKLLLAVVSDSINARSNIPSDMLPISSFTLEQIMKLPLLFLLAMMFIVNVLGGDCDITGNSRDYEDCRRPECLDADSTDDSSAGCECRLVVQAVYNYYSYRLFLPLLTQNDPHMIYSVH